MPNLRTFHHPTRVIPAAVALPPDTMVLVNFVAASPLEVGLEAAAEGVAEDAVVERKRPLPVLKYIVGNAGDK